MPRHACWSCDDLGQLQQPPALTFGPRRRLLSADDLEVLVDKDVVWPVDADVVDVVLAVAELHDAVDDTPRVSSQRGLRRLIRCCSADDRP